MSQSPSLPPCTYREVLRLLGKSEETPDGFDLILLNGRGEIVQGLSAMMAGRYRVAVNRDFYRSISDATPRIMEQIESVLFKTRETVTFNLDMRIATQRRRAGEIAVKHFHESREPEKVFYAYLGNLFRRLLEDSAQEHNGGVDARIASYKETWEQRLKEAVEDRFGIEIEFNFLVDKPITQDRSIATEPSAPLYVAFTDRIDLPQPLRVEFRLRELERRKGKATLPRNDQILRDNLLAVVRQVCERQLALFDFWYRRDAMQKAVTAGLNEYLAEFGHQAVNLVIVPDNNADRAAPLSVKLDCSVNWRDSRGHQLDFRAEAIAEVDVDGAGAYDRAGRPDRATWFETTITNSLRHVLAGVAINDLDKAEIARCNDQVRNHIAATAKAIGLKLEVYFGSVSLPLQHWQNVRRVKVPARQYGTAHPKITGDFSMDIEVRFESLKALEPFLVRFADAADSAGRNGLPDDAFIEQQLVKAAVEAAELVMQATPADIYFRRFIGAADWNASLPGLPDPGGLQDDRNLIVERLTAILADLYPGVTLVALHFHRLDRGLEKLRELVAQIRTIDFTCTIVDRLRGDAGLDRVLTGNIPIVDGDAGSVVMMMMNDFQTLPVDVFRNLIRKRLEAVVETALSFASQSELESLMGSLTQIGGRFTHDTAVAVKQRIAATLTKEFGLVAGDITLNPGLSEGEKAVRETAGMTSMGPLKTLQVEIRLLSDEFTALLSQRMAITDTTPQANAERTMLTERLDSVQKRMDHLQRNAQVRIGYNASDFIDDAAATYLNPDVQKLIKQNTALPRPNAPSPRERNDGDSDEADDDIM